MKKESQQTKLWYFVLNRHPRLFVPLFTVQASESLFSCCIQVASHEKRLQQEPQLKDQKTFDGLSEEQLAEFQKPVGEGNGGF